MYTCKRRREIEMRKEEQGWETNEKAPMHQDVTVEEAKDIQPLLIDRGASKRFPPVLGKCVNTDHHMYRMLLYWMVRCSTCGPAIKRYPFRCPLLSLACIVACVDPSRKASGIV